MGHEGGDAPERRPQAAAARADRVDHAQPAAQPHAAVRHQGAESRSAGSCCGGRSGKLLKTPKGRLGEDPRLQRGYDTIIRIVEEAYGEGTDIVAKFKR